VQAHPSLIHKRNGRMRPTALIARPPSRAIDKAMDRAIAQGLSLAHMLENGTHATIAEIAATEKINESYVGRVLRVTLLAPDIVEAILAGREAAELKLDELLRRFPVSWREQQRAEMLEPSGATVELTEGSLLRVGE
jgi:hypothetical protein